MKIYLYFFGKPRDGHSNAMAQDYLDRIAHYAKAEMSMLRQDRDPWTKHPSAYTICLDPAGKSLDTRAFVSMVERCGTGSPRPGFRGRRRGRASGGMGRAGELAAVALADDFSARAGSRHAGRADL